MARKTILDILEKNKNAEDELANMTESGLISDASVANFLELTNRIEIEGLYCWAMINLGPETGPIGR